MITLKLFLLLSASIFYFSCKSVTVCIAVFITSNSGWGGGIVVVICKDYCHHPCCLSASFNPSSNPCAQPSQTPTLYLQEKPSSSYPAAYCCDFVVIPYLFSTSPFDFICYICYTNLAIIEDKLSKQ